jgi:hypothetical protein
MNFALMIRIGSKAILSLFFLKKKIEKRGISKVCITDLLG